MGDSFEDPSGAAGRPCGQDDLGTARGILLGSVCGGLAWGMLAASFWLLLFSTIRSD